MATQQFNLFDKETKRRYSRLKHGGGLNEGKRKLERPLSTKDWIHVVLKSEKARGRLSLALPKNKIAIQKIVMGKAKKFGVKIADSANVGNHIHLQVRMTSRKGFQNFLRAVTTLIARHVTGARKGRPFGKFWDALAFTRILKSFKEFENLRGYMEANRTEASLSYSAREKFRKKFNDWLYRGIYDPLETS